MSRDAVFSTKWPSKLVDGGWSKVGIVRGWAHYQRTVGDLVQDVSVCPGGMAWVLQSSSHPDFESDLDSVLDQAELYASIFAKNGVRSLDGKGNS